MDRKGRSLSETVWTRMDRKAGAIIELTMRQLRHRVSTWVVLGVGALLMALLLTFYVDSVRESFEPIDNDGDSVDNDNEEALWSTFAYLLKIKVRCRFDCRSPPVVLTHLAPAARYSRSRVVSFYQFRIFGAFARMFALFGKPHVLCSL